MSDYSATDREMDWSDTISAEKEERVILEEGNYNYTVTGFERARYMGSQKIPACNKAEVTLTVQTKEGKEVKVRSSFFLHSSFSWKIVSFFESLGLVKDGEECHMQWDKILGKRGTAHFKPRTYQKDGEERTVNNVDYFVPYSISAFKEEFDDDIPF